MMQKARYIQRTFALIWSAAKWWTLIWVILLGIQSVIPILLVVLTKESVDNFVTVIQSDWDFTQLESALLPLILLGFIQVLSRVISTILVWVRLGQAEQIRDYISERIHIQSLRLDMSYYEQKSFYDLMHRARTEARDRPLNLLESSGVLIQNILSTIGLAVLLVSYSAWLLPLLTVGALPALWVMTRFSQRLNRWRKENTLNERRVNYYENLLTERFAASELRIYKLGDYYRSRYIELRRKLRGEKLKLWRDRALLEILVMLFSTLIGGITLVWMGLRVITKAAPLGDLAGLYQIFSQVQSSLAAIAGRINDVYQGILFVEDLYIFLDLPAPLIKVGEATAPPLRQELRFENISFRYPESERQALINFSMTIPAGKIVALVGNNGEGKTTLMKLLCHFYDPQEGRILWDDKILTDFSVESLYRQISMLFQSPFFYPETIRHNISVGDLEMNPSLEDLQKAAKASSAHDIIMSLPQQYETMLGKWYGGEELSAGQWQRIVLARAFLRKSSLIILDEPTSAMDAWAEMDWLSRIREAARGQTMIMITHRFTTAMEADLIYVMHEQKIVEQGTHDELLALDGRYAQSWREQMRHRGSAPNEA